MLKFFSEVKTFPLLKLNSFLNFFAEVKKMLKNSLLKLKNVKNSFLQLKIPLLKLKMFAAVKNSFAEVKNVKKKFAAVKNSFAEVKNVKQFFKLKISIAKLKKFFPEILCSEVKVMLKILC